MLVSWLARMSNSVFPVVPSLLPVLSVKCPSPSEILANHLTLIMSLPLAEDGFTMRFLTLIHSSFPVKSFHPFHSLRHTSRIRSMRKHMTFASDPTDPV